MPHPKVSFCVWYNREMFPTYVEHFYPIYHIFLYTTHKKCYFIKKEMFRTRTCETSLWGRSLVQVTMYRRLLIGWDGHLDQSETYDIS